MNTVHRLYCRSAHWARAMEARLLPWVVGDTDLGDAALEVGPGPGVATRILRERTKHLTAIEIDPKLAASLQQRMESAEVRVVEGDATDMPFDDGTFTGAVSLTMLHHVPSPALQDRLLREVHRVLRPGAWFVGSDSVSSRLFEWVHLFDTLVPVDPSTIAERLEAAGFAEVEVGRSRRHFRFRARKPAGAGRRERDPQSTGTGNTPT